MFPHITFSVRRSPEDTTSEDNRGDRLSLVTTLHFFYTFYHSDGALVAEVIVF